MPGTSILIKSRYNSSRQTSIEVPARKDVNMNKKTMIIIFAMSLIVSACGFPSAADTERISTAAAQTVEARFTQMAVESATPEPTKTQKKPSPTLTMTPTKVPTSLAVPDGCLVANFVSETVPDGTLIETGAYFWKSWTIQNNGTCTWNKNYKLVFWDGDLLGAAGEYNFFDDISPGETMNFPIQLLAPNVAGNYQGSWKIKSPSGAYFGVGQYDVPISVNVNVGDPGDLEPGITSVVYSLTREPEFGCPANVFWTITATITVNGKMNIRAQFSKSDGTHEPKETLFFDKAGSKTMSMTWPLFKGAGPAPRWVQLSVIHPEEVLYPTYTFVNNCPDQVD